MQTALQPQHWSSSRARLCCSAFPLSFLHPFRASFLLIHYFLHKIHPCILCLCWREQRMLMNTPVSLLASSGLQTNPPSMNYKDISMKLQCACWNLLGTELEAPQWSDGFCKTRFLLETGALNLGDADWAPLSADRQPNAACHSDLKSHPDQSEHIGSEPINGKLKSLLSVQNLS